MLDTPTLSYNIKDSLELNLSYMPFIKGGGLFIPTQEHFPLHQVIQLSLSIPDKNINLLIEAQVVWVTPKNALHQVLPGIGVQFIGTDAAKYQNQLEALLDRSMDIGGYTYGITLGSAAKKK